MQDDLISVFASVVGASLQVQMEQGQHHEIVSASIVFTAFGCCCMRGNWANDDLTSTCAQKHVRSCALCALCRVSALLNHRARL